MNSVEFDTLAQEIREIRRLLELVLDGRGLERRPPADAPKELSFAMRCAEASAHHERLIRKKAMKMAGRTA